MVCVMASPPSRKWLSMAVLAIIIPISVLTTFKLAGIIPEPPTIANTIETGPVNWNVTRPSDSVIFRNEVAENSYSGDAVTINLSVLIDRYMTKSLITDNSDCVWLLINTTSQVSQGFIHSMLIRFSRAEDDAYLLIHKFDPWPKVHGLEIGDIVTFGSNVHEAYTSANGIGQPKKCSLEILVSWHFLDSNNISHWTTAFLETVYFNGTTYRKVIMPIGLGVLAS